MSQNRFWNLLAKKLSGEALPEEITELEQLMKENPDWIYPASHIKDLWQLPEKPDLRYDAELAFESHLAKLKEQGISLPQLEGDFDEELVPQKRNRSKILVFSFLIIAISITSFFLFSREKEQPSVPEKAFSEVATKPGSKTTKLILPDSTVVWLNAGSKLSYADNFGITNRNTTLSGEAFFDVKKSALPFIIHANGVQVKVLGTAFNVKSYPDEKTTETTLIRGRVEITLDKRPGEKFILKPNEKLVVANESPKTDSSTRQKTEPIVVLSGITQTEDNSIIETSWVENKLVFDKESFSDLAKRMERWFGVTIIFRDEKIAAEKLTGTFTTETVQEALEELQMSTPFHFSLKTNTIIITQ